MMNRNIAKKVTALTLGSVMLALAGTAVFAASDAKYTKNENVYTALDNEGKELGTYIVNTFDVTKEGEITDYGDYDKVSNLTNLDTIESDKEEHTFRAKEGKFYYQGDMSDAELPWLIDIEYYLDDDEVTPEEIAGETGDLEMKIHVKRNPQVNHNEYMDHYMLQISVPMDTDVFDKITCKDGILSDAGKNEQASFVVAPGAEGDFKITAEVENFELDSITLNGVQQVYEVPSSENSEEMVPVHIPSFTSDDNKDVGQVMFMMSTEGISIPEEKTEEIAEAKKSAVQTFIDRLTSLIG